MGRGIKRLAGSSRFVERGHMCQHDPLVPRMLRREACQLRDRGLGRLDSEAQLDAQLLGGRLQCFEPQHLVLSPGLGGELLVGGPAPQVEASADLVGCALGV